MFCPVAGRDFHFIPASTVEVPDHIKEMHLQPLIKSVEAALSDPKPFVDEVIMDMTSHTHNRATSDLQRQHTA